MELRIRMKIGLCLSAGWDRSVLQKVDYGQRYFFSSFAWLTADVKQRMGIPINLDVLIMRVATLLRIKKPGQKFESDKKTIDLNRMNPNCLWF